MVSSKVRAQTAVKLHDAGLCGEDADDLERDDVPVVLLTHQLALDVVRARRDTAVDHLEPAARKRSV